MKNLIQTIAYFQEDMKEYDHFVRFSDSLWKDSLIEYEQAIINNDFDSLKKFGYRTDLFSNLSDTYPQYQSRSYLVILLSMFEDFLEQLLILKKSSTKLSKESIGESKIYRLGYELDKCGLNFPLNSTDFLEVSNAQKIRNVIIHSSGHLDNEKHSEQVDIINNDTTLKALEYARVPIEMSIDYVLKIIEKINIICIQLSSLARESNKQYSSALGKEKTHGR